MTHKVEEWFNEADSKGVVYTPVQWFENKFKRNKLGTFKVPASVAKRFNLADEAVRNALFISIAQTYIDVLQKQKKKIKQLPFKAMLDEDRELLREWVCDAVQFCVLNNQVYQIVVGSNISTPSFTINVDTTPWVISADMIGMSAWNILSVVDIEAYDWVDTAGLWHATTSGNAQVITKTSDLAVIKELIL